MPKYKISYIEEVEHCVIIRSESVTEAEQIADEYIQHHKTRSATIDNPENKRVASSSKMSKGFENHRTTTVKISPV